MKEKSFLNSIKKHPVKSALFGVLALILLSGLSFGLWIFVLRPGKPMLSEAPARNIPIHFPQKGPYYIIPESPKEGSIIAYMYESGATDKLFSEFFDTDVCMAPKVISSVRMFSSYLSDLDESFGDDYPPYILLGIDPYASFLQSCSNKKLYMENLSFIREVSEAHPYCMFLVQYPDDSALFWNNLSGDDLDNARYAYINPVREFYDIINVRFLYHSVDEWVLYPQCLREGDHLTTRVEDNLLALDISSLSRTLRADTVGDVLDRVIADSKEYNGVYESYADLRDKKVFFLGDSVFGNFRDETAISTFFADMTGASVYNTSLGGVSAVSVADDSTEIGTAFAFLTKDADKDAFDRIFPSYEPHDTFIRAEADLSGTDGEDCIFIVEYGLNDYLGAQRVEDYSAAMEHIILTLKSKYPSGQVLVLAPGYISKYSLGDYIFDEGGSMLREYRDETVAVSEKTGTPCINLMDIPGFSQENCDDFILPDGIHYNEKGRYMIAQHLARYLKDLGTAAK